jgi:hypothetical protein
VAPYIAHSLLLIAGDWYYEKLAIKTIGMKASGLALFLYYCNSYYNEYIIRCLGNSVETILHIVVFCYYLEINERFDKNIKIVAGLLCVAMGIRNTSILGWVPLLLIKLY